MSYRKMTSVVLLTGLLLGIAGYSAAAIAWGAKGHRIVALVAEAKLSVSTKSALQQLLGGLSLTKAATYMDENRGELEKRYPGSRQWHYDDIPICDTRSSSNYCAQGRCASQQIRRHYEILVDHHSSEDAKRFSILVLVHLVGDIHQPLHAADFKDDRGGNDVKVKLPGSSSTRKLHGVWDTDIIRRMYGGQDESVVAMQLVTKFSANMPQWSKGNARSWIIYSHGIAKNYVYPGVVDGFNCSMNIEGTTYYLKEGYLKGAVGIIEEQLAKAGFRLAYLLNRALGD